MPGIVDIQRAGVMADRARVLCILAHGRNQSPEAMETAVVRHLSTPDVAFALPRAGEKCWYTALAIDPLCAKTWAELGTSLQHLASLVESLRDQVPGAPVVLAGFSQGACLALEHAFTGKPPPTPWWR